LKPSVNSIASIATSIVEKKNSRNSPRANSSKGLKFEDYSPRKDIVKKGQNKILTYIDYDHRKFNGIKFDRVTKRSNDLFAVMAKSPSVGTYRPNYNTIYTEHKNKSNINIITCLLILLYSKSWLS